MYAIRSYYELFGAEFANVQPHSGSQANAAVCMALLNPGDTLLGMSLAEGGHLTHGTKVNFSGRLYNAVQYGIDHKTALIDYDRVQALASEHKPKLVIAGFSAYSRVITSYSIHYTKLYEGARPRPGSCPAACRRD